MTDTKVYAVAETVPESSGYLTAGKRYEAIDANARGFSIVDDDRDRIYCRWEDCAHGGNWTRVEEPAPTPTTRARLSLAFGLIAGTIIAVALVKSIDAWAAMWMASDLAAREFVLSGAYLWLVGLVVGAFGLVALAAAVVVWCRAAPVSGDRS